MSAYAALVSLQQTLETILDRGGPRILRIRAQLRSLREKVIFLVDFLEKPSCIQQPALERKMREAAYKAENLVEIWICGILDSESKSLRNLMKMTFRYLVYAVVVSLVPRDLAAIAICTIYAVVMHLALPVDDDDLKAQKTRELRRVLHDFSNIEQDVIQIREASGEQELLGNAALISLQQTLDSVLGTRISHNRTQLESLHDEVRLWLAFLGNVSAYTTTQNSELQNLDAKIRAAALEAKYLIEFQIPAQFIRNFYALMEVSLLASLSYLPAFAMLTIIMLPFINYKLFFATSSHVTRVCTQLLVRWFLAIFFGFGALVLGTGGAEVVFLVTAAAADNSDAQEEEELRQVIDTLSNIMSKAIDQIKDACGNPSDLPPAASSRRDMGGTGTNVVVGLEGDIQHIRARLVEESSKLEVASILGMGGIGKTTLARLVYNYPDIVSHFDIRAWVTVSQEYSLHRVLLCLLDSANMLTEKVLEDDNMLAEHLHKSLKGRRYLIVMDDVWDTGIWDSISTYFPENHNRSRVLLTSRLSNVAKYIDSSCPIHQMRCLTEDDSWYLLRETVFGGESCPLELESTGREIARNCGGLPLAILVIGGLLYKDNQNKIWRDVAENLNSILRQTGEECLEILGLSYNRLPHHLRPCFLYMGVFPRDCEIPVSRLISLWVAEGFLKPCTSKSLEEVAEDNLQDLIDRNLIFVCKWSCNGKIRTFSIHDLLRDVSMQNGHKENFLHVVESGGYVTRERRDQTPRRLSIHPDALQVNATHDLISCYYYVRSFLCIASKPTKDPSVGFLGFLYLRVLDALVVHFEVFPDQIIELVSLRYLALSYDGPLPPSMSKLQYLETIVHHHSVCETEYPLLPPVVWNMPNLRHLYVKPGCYLSDPLGHRLPWNSTVLEHLQTLMGIKNFRWSKGIIKRIPNLKKLGISYDAPPSGDWSEYELESLVHLHQLEILKMKYDGSGSANLPTLGFPQNLKKLCLTGIGIPWARIGKLPNLEALKLRCEACSGPSWETFKGQFPKLIFLLLEQISFTRWETEADHFPHLQRLVIRSCDLQEIPYAIGDISTLEMIKLVHCLSSAVDSAKEIQQDQESSGNEVLKFHIEP